MRTSHTHSRSLLRPLLVGLLAVAAACGHPAQTGVDDNKSLWAGKRPARYQYSFRWSCFCATEFTDPVTITVENNAVTKVVNAATSQPVARPGDYRTIDGLFTFLQDAIDRGADQITVAYDPTWGFPRQATVDYIKNAADDEMAFTASDLTVLQ